MTFAKPLTLSLISHYLLRFVNVELTLTLSSGYIITWHGDRKQCVVVNGATSLPTSVVSGVPQGPILGPLLFLIYIDDIADVSLSDGSKIVLYADDILLYRPISLPVDLKLLQRDVDALETYASANYLTFNVAKCKFMLVSRKKRHINPFLYMDPHWE